MPDAAALTHDDGGLLDEPLRRTLAELHRRHDDRRLGLLARRRDRARRLVAGERLAPEAAGDWRVPPAPAPLQRRLVEITGPAEPRMIVNALNSGADGFMADFEDALSPTWANVVGGHHAIRAAAGRTLTATGSDGEERSIAADAAVLHVRPRGWHLAERHVQVDGRPMSASLFDAAVFVLGAGRDLAARGQGPYLYLPKLEGAEEAALWADVLCDLEDRAGLDRGTVRVTVLVETLPGALEMEEILLALHEHITAMNAGRWDYIFSAIKVLGDRPGAVLPDRSAITMTVPFMAAYTATLVDVCHRHAAHAMGGMAALVPRRGDEEATARAVDAVAADKRREAEQGFDGTWVAHPDVVEVARREFEAVLGGRPNQLDRLPEQRPPRAALLDLASTPGEPTAAGLREGVDVALRYLGSWLAGSGAVAIRGLMEDAATAEIARSLVWQWRRHGAVLDDGRTVDAALVRGELETVAAALRSDGVERVDDAAELFLEAALPDELPPFLPGLAYEHLRP